MTDSEMKTLVSHLKKLQKKPDVDMDFCNAVMDSLEELNESEENMLSEQEQLFHYIRDYDPVSTEVKQS